HAPLGELEVRRVPRVERLRPRLAHLVDDQRDAQAVRRQHQALEERRLPRPEEAGEHGDGEHHAACGRRLRPRAPASSLARNCPVYDRSIAATASGVPTATTSPPRAPPSGPRPMTQSAVFTTSSVCSITTTVLPPATSRFSTSSSFFTSAKCSPVVGSSSRYSVRPVSRLASSRDSFTRWASPPDSVVAGCPSARYPSPTSSSVRRTFISRRIAPNSSSACVTGLSSTCDMFFPL